jgi:hypothetical protein
MTPVRMFSPDSREFRLYALTKTKGPTDEFVFWTDFEAALRRRMEKHFGESESSFNNRHRGQVGDAAASRAGAIPVARTYNPGDLDVGFDGEQAYAGLLSTGERHEMGRPSMALPDISVRLDARTLENATERLARVIAELDRTINVLIALNKRREEEEQYI